VVFKWGVLLRGCVKSLVRAGRLRLPENTSPLVIGAGHFERVMQPSSRVSGKQRGDLRKVHVIPLARSLGFVKKLNLWCEIR
jgi:hypothetical protein